ncbi:MAG: trypsin-like peptidase domain-containing protein [Deltaproteobacteria bacterium]|nr:trypsin-like peptidase domain-containing protein [Deltaproteobacteria bacterium]
MVDPIKAPARPVELDASGFHMRVTLQRGLAVCSALSLLTMGPALGCRRVDEPAPTLSAPPPRVEQPAGPAAPASNGGRTVIVPDFARVAAGLSPSVVTVISTVPRRGSQGQRKTIRGVGSGMLVSARGQVLTNEHVVADATRVQVELDTGNRLDARVLHADPMLDLALLELEGVEGDGLVPVEFADGDPTPGEWVMAVGQPFGLGHTVTVGVISGLGRDHGDLGRPPGLRADGIWSFIQTDASINIGNSGGPLVDADGKVVGIATAVRSDGQGLAFAIPAPMARRFLEEVWTHGRVRHTRLGIKADNAIDGEPPGRGSVVRITEVEQAGPAAKAELVPGDFILAINDHPVSRVSDVAYLTQLHGVGARLTMTVKRGLLPAEQVLIIPAAAP